MSDITKPVDEIFATVAKEHPDRIAVAHNGTQTTYAQLHDRAFQLAGWLDSLHETTGDAASRNAPGLVAFCMQPGIARTEIMLAALVAGSAFVPIDPDFPDDRIRYILDDIGTGFIVCDEANRARLTNALQDAPRSISIDLVPTTHNETAADSSTKHQTRNSTETLAYIMYTSGSTGRPKGVAIPHRGIVRLVVDTNFIEFETGDVVAHLSNVAFDASTLEIWGPLLNGARIEIVDRDIALDHRRLKAKITETGITAMWLTFGLFSQHVLSDVSLFSGLKYLLFGGEAAAPDIVRRIMSSPARPQHVINGYGPTENTTFSLTHEFLDVPDQGAPIPIGRDIANSGSALVDESLKPIDGPGQGELLLSGPGLALGYFGDAVRTAEKFIRTAWSDELLYRTGDIVRRLSDGNYVFIGRLDNQVKIRGHRIELEEIENTLTAHPAIDGAVILVSEDGAAGTKLLSAYLHTTSELPPVRQIRAHLGETLPAYMIPSRFCQVERFPLLSMDKVDRATLADMTFEALQDTDQHAGFTGSEAVIAEIWARQLKCSVAAIGPDDSFFDLGGDSLAGIEVLAEIETSFKIPLAVSTLFECRTIGDVAKLLGGKSAPVAAAEPHERWNGEDPLPLSPHQEQIWLHQQQAPDQPFYNEPITVTLPEQVDVEALTVAIRHLCARHEALRSRFQLTSKGVTQSFADAQSSPVDVEFIDLRHMPDGVARSEATQLATRLSRKPFDLAGDAPVRFQIIRLREAEYRLDIVAHHLVFDGVSMYRVMLPELQKTYRAMTGGLQLADADPAISYPDYVLTSIKSRDAAIDAQGTYWRNKLAGMAEMNMAGDNPRGSQPSFAGARHKVSIPAPLVARLRSLSATSNSTLFITLVAGFKILLKKLLNQPDITVATAAAARMPRGAENLVGCFINTLLLRTALPDEGSFHDVLAAVRQSCLEAYDNKDLPLQNVRKLSGCKTTTFGNIAFVLEPSFTEDVGDWHLSQLDVHTGTSKLDLSVELDERDGGIIGRVEYNTDILRPETVEQLFERYLHVLEQVAENPDRDHNDISLLGHAERLKVLTEWNDTGVSYGGPVLLHELVEAQCDRTPDATAIICAGERLSYAELDRKANNHAHHLAQHGVGPGDVVVVWTDRTAEHIVSLLGVLKAGAAYVPAAAEDPADRVALLAGDSGAKLVICDEPRFDRLHRHNIATLNLDAERDAIAVAADHRPATPVSADSLAYIIYTSGTTGRPKGVMIEHRQVADRGHWAKASFRLREGDGFMHLFSLAFDAAVLSSWWVLAQGATIVLPGSEEITDPVALVSLTRKHHVTALCATPSLLSPILDAREQHQHEPVKLLMAGGEALSPDLARRMQGHARVVMNLYGPTEATVLATAWQIPQAGISKSLIGRPVANTRIYIVDDSLKLVSHGVPGEILIGGDGVARGYLNRPEQTAQHFFPDPFSDNPDARVYRTGDMGRFLPSGEIEHLGRRDRQVKIRGFRVELGEIEAVLAGFDSVTTCAVITRKTEAGGTQLVAYYVASDTVVSAQDLHDRLGDMLPKNMVPSWIIPVEALPLTPNGKLDETALPEPDDSYARQNNRVAPRTPIECKLAEVWQQVIGDANIGINDDFFDIGGDSLSVMNVVLEAETAGMQFSVNDVFTHRTIGELAERITARNHAMAGADAPLATMSYEAASEKNVSWTNGSAGKFSDDPTVPQLRQLQQGTMPALFLVHPAGGSSLCYRALVDGLSSPRAIFGIEVPIEQPGEADNPLSLVDTARAYVEQIRKQQPDGPYWLGGWSLGGVIAYEICRQLEAVEEQVATVFLIDARLPTVSLITDTLGPLAADTARSLDMAVRDLERLSGNEIPVSHALLSKQDPDKRLETVLANLREAGMLDPEIINSFAEPFLRSYMGAARMLAEYSWGACKAKLLLLQARDGPEDQDSRIETVNQIETEWREVSQKGVVSHVVPGTHENLMSLPFVKAVADQVDITLRRGSKKTSLLPSLAEFDTNNWNALLSEMTMLPFTAGEYLVREGEIGRDLLVISDGYLDVYNRAKGPDIPVRTLGPNSVIGELAFLDAGPRTFSLRAVSDGVAYALSAEAFEHLAQKNTKMAMRLLHDVSEILANRFRGLYAETAKSKPTREAAE